MKISFKKQIDTLEREAILKSVDLDDDVKDFNFEVRGYNSKDNFISISPTCVRCNLCYDECPVNAIGSSSLFKIANIKENCVKCEICVQSCPISCIYSVNASVDIDENQNKGIVNYYLTKKDLPHRILRLYDISVDLSKCNSCGSCDKYCPTGAISPRSKEFFKNSEFYDLLDEEKLYPHINKKLCIGCGSCKNLCSLNLFNLKRIIGPIMKTKELLLNQDICVNCYLCEENCPVEAINLVDGDVIIDRDKCIRCNTCSDRCPVAALRIVDLDKEGFNES